MRPRVAIAVSLLLLATLACNALNPASGVSTATTAPTENQTLRVSTETPAATTSQTLRVSSATPAPTSNQTLRVSTETPAPTTSQTLRVSSATPAAQALPFTLDSAADAQAAMLPQFAADVRSLPDASRYVIDVTITFSGVRSATLTGRELIRYPHRQADTLDCRV